MKKYDSSKVAEALCRKIEKSVIEDKKRKEQKRVAKLLKIGRRGLFVSLIMLCGACSLADPAVGGYSGGADAFELSIPEKGTVSRTVTITRHPDGLSGVKGGRVYNQSGYESFNNWLFGKVN